MLPCPLPSWSHLTYKFLSEELYEYLDAAIMVQTSPEEAYRKVLCTEEGDNYVNLAALL